MKKNNLRPHVHSELIKAWADGHKIERYYVTHSNWIIELNPIWNKNYEYRIYDPLREVKEAYENGSTIEQYNLETGKVVLSYKLDEYKEYLKRNTIEGLPIFTPSWNTKWGWRIKPVDDFKIGDLVKEIKSNNVYRIVEKEEDVDRFHLQLSYIQNDNNSFKKATKEEVLNASNYDGSATGEDFPFEIGDVVNSQEIKGEKEILKDNADIIKAIRYEYTYAIKEKPKEYVPFTWEDREQLKGKWIKHKELKDEELIISLTADEDDWIITHDKNLSGENLLDNYLFLDGSLCGKLKK